MLAAGVLPGVPTLYVRMLAEPSLTPEACGLIRLFVAGSAPLTVPLPKNVSVHGIPLRAS